MNSLRGIDVVILAGGRGTRLRSAVGDVPKVLAPIQGRPFLEYLIDVIRSNGGRRILLALGVLNEKVQEFVNRRKWAGTSIECVVEPEARGTGGAIAEVSDRIQSETTMVLNGDSYTWASVEAFLGFHRNRAAEFSLIATLVPDASRFGLIHTDDEGRIFRIEEKPDAAQEGFVNTGVYLLERCLIDRIPRGREISLERELLPAWTRAYAWRGRFPFVDIGTPESYSAALTLFASA